MTDDQWIFALLAVLTLAFVGVFGFFFHALFSWMKADSALQEERHQLRLTRIRAGLPPD